MSRSKRMRWGTVFGVFCFGAVATFSVLRNPVALPKGLEAHARGWMVVPGSTQRWIIDREFYDVNRDVRAELKKQPAWTAGWFDEAGGGGGCMFEKSPIRVEITPFPGAQTEVVLSRATWPLW